VTVSFAAAVSARRTSRVADRWSRSASAAAPGNRFGYIECDASAMNTVLVAVRRFVENRRRGCPRVRRGGATSGILGVLFRQPRSLRRSRERQQCWMPCVRVAAKLEDKGDATMLKSMALFRPPDIPSTR
jgi:hypothetical protein